MEKIIKKYGGSLIILLDNQDIEIYDLKEGDLVDIELVKKKGGKK